MKYAAKIINKHLGLLSIAFLLCASILFSWFALEFNNDVNSFGLAYKLYAAKVSFVLFLLTALLKFFRQLHKNFPILPLVAIICGITAILAGGFVVKDADWRYQFVGDVGYRIPRSYAVDLDYGPPSWGIRAIYCAKNMSGGRLKANADCEHTYLLLLHPSSPHYVEIDSLRELSCNDYNTGLKCRIITNTKLGQLNYEVETRSTEPDQAQAYEKKLINLLTSWQIKDGI